MAEVNSDVEALQQSFTQLTTNFGETSTMTSEEFFGILEQFIRDFEVRKREGFRSDVRFFLF